MKKEFQQKQFDTFKVFYVNYTEVRPFDLDLICDIKKEIKKHIKDRITHYELTNYLNKIVLCIFCDITEAGGVSGIDYDYLSEQEL